MQRYIKIYICYLEQGYNYQSSCIFNQAFLKFPRNNAIFVSRYNITPKNKNKMENKKSECSIKYTTRMVPTVTGFYARPMAAASGTRSSWSNLRFAAASAAAGFSRRQR